VEFSNFDCIDTVANSFITEAELDMTSLGTNCTNWGYYHVDLSVNGSVVAENLCEINSVNLTEYGVDINNLTSVTLTTYDDDDYSDGMTVSATLDLAYIVTTCPPPTGVTASNIEPYTADISWTSNGTESLWNIEVVNLTNGDTATGVATYSGVSVNPYALSGLSPDTEYAVLVQSDCGPLNADPQSIWSVATTFTTPPTCIPLGAISIDSVSDNSVSISWSQASSEIAWDIELINITNGDTFTFVPNYDDLSSNNPTLTGLLPETDYSFIVRADCGAIDGASVWTNVYNFTTLPTCQAPTALTLDGVTNDEITVSWTSEDNETEWYIELVNITLGETVSGIATDSSTTTSYTVNGLNGSTEYEIYVSANCGLTDGISDWVGPITVTTLCDPGVAPYFYDVETHPTTTSAAIEDCWEADPENTSSSYRWNVDGSGSTPSGDTGPSGAFSGSNYFYTEASGYSFGDVATLTSRELDVNALVDPTLSFMYHMYGQNMGNLYIDVLYNGNWIMDVDSIIGQQQTAENHEWLKKNVDLSAYTTSLRVRFRAVRGDGYESDISIDDISIDSAPTCFMPTSVSIDSIYANAVDITMDTTGTNATSWAVELVNITNGDTLTGVPTMIATTPTFQVTGLDHSSMYELYIISVCSATDSAEVYTDSFMTLCMPNAMTWSEDFVDWEPVCFDFTGGNTSFQHYTAGGNTAVEADFWSDQDGVYHMTTPEVIIDVAARLKFKWSHRYSSTYPFDQMEVLISNDGTNWSSVWLKIGPDFDSNDGAGNTSPGSYTEAILPIDTSYIGSNIQVKFIATSDYGPDLFIDQIVVEPLPDCDVPVDFVLVSSEDTSAIFDWASISLDTLWNLELVNISNGDTATGVATHSSTMHPFTMGGLLENTIYDVYLSSDCDTSNTWLGPVSFVTDWSNDLGVSTILSPAAQGCNLGDSMQIEVEITNYGGQAQTGFDIELSWDDTTYVNAGTFTDTIAAGATATFILDGYYDFSTALDTTFWVQTALLSDSVETNNGSNSSVTNLGNMLINVQVNTGEYAGEVYWEIVDTVNNVTAYATSIGAGYSDYTTYNTDVCVYAGGDYVMNAWDTYGDGWNGGTYSVTRCGGIILANNDGNEVTNGGGSFNPNDLEVQEGFHVDECPDDDLAVLAIDGLDGGCGLGQEVGEITIMNFGNNDVAANGATAQYQFNNSGLWIDFWDFDTGLESQEDTVLTMPAVDMSIAGVYTVEVQIVFAADEDTTTNYLATSVTSVPTLTEDSTTFNSGNGGWTSHIINGVNNSWEYGIPTTAVAGNGNDQEVWATNLSGNASLNETSYLLSPCYDFSSYVEDVEVTFDFVRTDFNHTFQLQSSIDGGANWTNLWFVTSNTTTWTNQLFLISGLAGESDVKFRWRHESSFNTPIEGFAFDNWEVYEHVPYTDATLSDLTVNGNTVTDPVTFDPAVYDYNYEVPFGSTVWDVNAVANAPFITGIVIDEPATLPGIATVTVTAEDTVFTQVYTVNITETPPSTDATLSSLEVSNNSVPGFNPDTLCYTVTFPNGSAFTPNVDAVTNDPNATFVINNTNIPGTATIVVTAQDGVTQNTYCIVYEEEQLSTDATLSDLTVDGVPIPGFDPATLSYTYEVPNGTTVVPTVGYTTTDLNATVDVGVGILPFPTATTVVVTAEDGVTIITYVVNFTEAAGTDATLMDLTLNGGTVTGFDSNTLIYNVELPFGSNLPTVDALPTDSDADVDITNASGVPGTTIILVTAEDGVTQITYYINWSYAAASNNADIEMITPSIGALNPAFDSGTFTYVLCVGVGVVDIAQLDIQLADTTATFVYLAQPTDPYGTYTIQVTAQDGTTTQTYTVDIDDCEPIGLDEELLEAIIVSPNPSTGIFTITTPSNLKDYNTAVFDQLGKVVYEREVINGTVEQAIDLTNLPSGVYNLRINTANDQIVKRISIIK
jgi:hypothetical protein